MYRRSSSFTERVWDDRRCLRYGIWHVSFSCSRRLALLGIASLHIQWLRGVVPRPVDSFMCLLSSVIFLLPISATVILHNVVLCLRCDFGKSWLSIGFSTDRFSIILVSRRYHRHLHLSNSSFEVSGGPSARDERTYPFPGTSDASTYFKPCFRRVPA